MPKLPRLSAPQPRDKRDDLESVSAPRPVPFSGEKAPANNEMSNLTSRSPSEKNLGCNGASLAGMQGTSDARPRASPEKRPTTPDNKFKSPRMKHSLLSISADLVSEPLPTSRSRSRLSSNTPDPFRDSKPSTFSAHSASAPPRDSPYSNRNRLTPAGPSRVLSAALSSGQNLHSTQRSASKPRHTEHVRTYCPIPKGRECSQHSQYRPAKHSRSFPEGDSVSNLNDDNNGTMGPNNRDDSRRGLGRGRGLSLERCNESEPDSIKAPANNFSADIDVTTSNEDELCMLKESHDPNDKAQTVQKKLNGVEVAEGEQSSVPSIERNKGSTRSILDVKEHATEDDRRANTEKENPLGGTETGLRSVPVDTIPSYSKVRVEKRSSIAPRTTRSPNTELDILTSPGEGCTHIIKENTIRADASPRPRVTKLSRLLISSSPANDPQPTGDEKLSPELLTVERENDTTIYTSSTDKLCPKNVRDWDTDDPKNSGQKYLQPNHLTAKSSTIGHEPDANVTKPVNVASPSYLVSSQPLTSTIPKNTRTDGDGQTLRQENILGGKDGKNSISRRNKPEIKPEDSPITLHSSRNRGDGSKRKLSAKSVSVSAEKSSKKRTRHSEGIAGIKNDAQLDANTVTSQEAVLSKPVAQQPPKIELSRIGAEPTLESVTKLDTGGIENLSIPSTSSKAHEQREGTDSTGKERVIPSSSAHSHASGSLSVPMPLYVPTLSLLLATSPRSRSRTSVIDKGLNTFGRLPLSKTPPLSARLGTAIATSPSDTEEREKIFREIREVDEKAKELELKIAALKKKANKEAQKSECCDNSTSVHVDFVNEKHIRGSTKRETQVLKKSFSPKSKNTKVSIVSDNRLMLPMQSHLRLLLVQNQSKANAASAALRELCHDTVVGLDAPPIPWKPPEPLNPARVTKIAKEIARRRQEAHEQNRRLFQEYGHFQNMWLHKLKVWKEKRSKEKREACRERDRQLLLSTRGQSALLTSRTSSGRMSTKIVPFVSGNGFANGSAELDAMLADIETEGGTPGSKEIWSRTLATIPDRIVGMRNFDCMSTLVEDPIGSLSMSRSVNPWMLHEIVIFLEKFTTFPKNFRKIASFLGHKCTQECAQFYFDKKLDLGLKQLVKEASTLKRKGLLRSQIVEIAKKRPSSVNSVVVAVKNGEVIRTSALEAVEMYVNDKEVQLIDDARGVEEVEYRKEMMEERRETVGYAMKLSERIRREWCGVDLSGIEHGQFMAAFRKFGTDWKALRTMLGADKVSSVQAREYYRMHWRRIEAEVVTKLVAAKRGKSEKNTAKATSSVSPRFVTKKMSGKTTDKAPLPTPKITANSYQTTTATTASASKPGSSTVATSGHEFSNRRPRSGKVPSSEDVTIETGKDSGTGSRRNSGRAEQDVRREITSEEKGNIMRKSMLKSIAKAGKRVDQSDGDYGKRRQERSGDEPYDSDREK